MAKGLGRLVARDPRDDSFGLQRWLPATLSRPARKTWRVWWKGDQGDTPMCVGYAWHALLRALPLLQRDPLPTKIYRVAQTIDEWPGEDYEGTSVRAGAKMLRAASQLSGFGWADNIETVVNWLATKSPVIIGSTWYEGMFFPDKNGRVDPAGSPAGGHAYIAIGYDDPKGLLICQNSWGTEWGLNGRFLLSYEDADALIKEDGEACTAVEI